MLLYPKADIRSSYTVFSLYLASSKHRTKVVIDKLHFLLILKRLLRDKIIYDFSGEKYTGIYVAAVEVW